MIVLVQFGINKHLQMFSKTNEIARARRVSAILCNCTRNHVITYTKKVKFAI